jgi:hypothetical protein
MTLTKDQITNSAKSVGLDYATVAAIASVESSGAGFDTKTNFPIILFEGHKFSKFTNGRFDKTNPTISYPVWTKQFYAKDQTGEQARLQTAIALDRNAALQSTSFGMFQIMGFNYGYCGCKDVQDFVNKMCVSEQSQLDLFLKFISARGMIPYLKAKAWDKFASSYNGPSYKQNNYDIKLANAYLKFSKEV